ncbi:MAG: PilZ domain-containing protein [Candidatus Desulfatibia sp.]|uniref:PilZ domain-containing protein n=1 Tax=Candidatus Desulfatibia sp. TaxID=3101189 RepID=UPI002F321F7F
MTNSKGFIEKRKHRRFKAKEGAFAVVTSGDNKIGQIKNISKGGLAFQYVASEKKLAGLLTMDIFRNSKEFYLKNVSVKTTSDIYVDNKSPFSTIILRQCGGKFADLADNQISQLDRFIQNYTIGEV